MVRPAQLQADRGNPRLKFLDRYVGIPAVAVLGSVHRVVRQVRRVRRSGGGAGGAGEEWQTIGVLLTSGIGDTVLATGVLQDLRATYPSARIILFVTANNASFARMLPTPDAIVELPVRQVWQAVRAVRAEAVDVIVDLSAWRRFDAVLAGLSGAELRVGLRTPRQFRHFVYDVVVDHGRDHEIENDRRLVAALGVVSDREPALTMPSEATAPLEQPYVVFHLWPGGANFDERSWPIESWHELAGALARRGFDLVLTGGPGDAPVAEKLIAAWGVPGVRVHNAAGGSWAESMAWLGFAAGVISVNTGVMHVAAALGTPTIALNGPTSGTRWGPRGPFTRSVASPMVPDGYLNLGFERDDRYRNCMAAITVQMVLQTWDGLMTDVRRARSGEPG